MVDRIASRYGQRPSDIVLDDRDDSLLRFDVDRAVMRFGVWFDAELARTDHKGKPVNTAQSLLTDHRDEDADAPVGRYADPRRLLDYRQPGRGDAGFAADEHG